MKSIYRYSILLSLVALIVSGNTEAQTKKTFNGMEKHDVSYDNARKMVKKAQSKMKKGAVKGGAFGRNIIERILAQPGCVGVRFYYAQTSKGAQTLVVAGIDSTGSDIKGLMGEDWVPCPPFCGATQGLSK